jgi:WD40 repeat protein
LSVYFTSDGHLLAVGMNHVTRWTVNGETGVPIIFGPTEKLLAGTGGAMASFTADGDTMALADYLRNTARLLPAGGGTNQRGFRHDHIAAVALSPNGQWLVTGELDRDPIRLWNTATGENIRDWPAAGDLRVVFSPDGRWLAQFGLNCRLWDTKTWQLGLAQPTLPRNSVLGGAAFSPDGRVLAVSAADHEIHLLAFPSLTPLAVLEAPHQLRINQLAWSGDGTHLAAATMQGEVQIWRWDRLREQLRGLGIE